MEAKRAKTKSASPRSCTVPHTPLCHGVSSLRLGIGFACVWVWVRVWVRNRVRVRVKVRVGVRVREP